MKLNEKTDYLKSYSTRDNLFHTNSDKEIRHKHTNDCYLQNSLLNISNLDDLCLSIGIGIQLIIYFNFFRNCLDIDGRLYFFVIIQLFIKNELFFEFQEVFILNYHIYRIKIFYSSNWNNFWLKELQLNSYDIWKYKNYFCFRNCGISLYNFLILFWIALDIKLKFLVLLNVKLHLVFY